jgi:hypothetical protein
MPHAWDGPRRTDGTEGANHTERIHWVLESSDQSLTTEAQNAVICATSLRSSTLTLLSINTPRHHPNAVAMLPILPRLVMVGSCRSILRMRTGHGNTRQYLSLSTSLRDLPYYHSSVAIMSLDPPGATSSSDYEVIFDNTLKAYKKKTGKDLASDPLLRRLETCNSPDSVLSLLRLQVPGFDQSVSGSSNERLTKWVNPAVNVLCTFSSTISGAVSLVGLCKIKVVRSRPAF